MIQAFTFREWLQEHREQFITFTIEEIADVALASGYSRREVGEWMGKSDGRSPTPNYYF